MLTFIDQVLVAIVGWLAPLALPSWKVKSLQLESASTYTAINNVWQQKEHSAINPEGHKIILDNILCLLVLTPQITGGVMPELLTLKVSVRHWVARDWARPVAALVTSPFFVLSTELEAVCGPVMVKEVKSSLSWKRHKFIQLNTLLAKICFAKNT